MVNVTRTNSENPDFKALVILLDAELHSIYGQEMDFFGQFNKIDAIKHVIVATIKGEPAGCGAIKRYDDDAAEVKRMFVKHEFRGKQIAKTVLQQLELWAAELGYTHTVLETGEHQQRAIALYLKNGYEITPNYGQYIAIDSSICMRKTIRESI